MQIKIVQNNVPTPEPAIEPTDFDIDLIVDIPDPVEPTTPVETEPPVTWAQHMPAFPGGEEAMFEFIRDNIKYPPAARDAGIKGRVYIQFVVDKKGKISNVEVLRGIGGGCEEEAMRVVEMMPKWTPGEQAGRKVSVIYRLPFKFETR